MSDMSFNQAKDLVERMEFSQIALKNASKSLDDSCKKFNQSKKNFDVTLEKQNETAATTPKEDKKVFYLLIIVAINIGFIIGLIFGKYIF
jgi:hypothetical protein